VFSIQGTAMTPEQHHGPSFRLVSAGVSDKGMVRSENQDRLAIYPEIGVTIVADGMGGAVAGDVAAHLAVERIGASLAADARERRTPDVSAMAERLVVAIQAANEAVLAAATGRTHLSGMGTTAVALHIRGKRAAVAHVGDSRLYQHRGGRLVQIAEDHTWHNDLVRAGVMHPDQRDTSHRRHVLTRAVGTRPTVEVETRVLDVAYGDVFLLCSDGLTNVIPRAELEATLRQRPDPDDAAFSLVKRANALGAPDNVTAVLIKCV
jgi:protein phosphatase